MLRVCTHGPLDEYRELAARKTKALRRLFPGQRRMCSTCAFRTGSEASRDPTLRAEFAAAVARGGPVVFYCHQGRVEDDPSTHRLCVGYLNAVSVLPGDD